MGGAVAPRRVRRDRRLAERRRAERAARGGGRRRADARDLDRTRSDAGCRGCPTRRLLLHALPARGASAPRPQARDTYWRRVYFHALSSAADGSADPLVFEGDVGTDAPSPEVSPDGRWLVINLFKGWNRLEVLLIDRRARVAAGARPTAVPVIAGDDTLSHASVHRGRLYVMTNRGAPKYRVLSADVAALYRSPPARREGVTTLDVAPAGPWRSLVPEGEHVIDDLTLAGDRMVLTYTENVASRVYVHDLNGRRLASVALPAEGTVPGVDANDDGDGAVFSFQSFFWPSRVYALDRAALHRAGEVQPAAVVEPAGGVDPSRFALDRASVPSRDGTPVNVFLLRPRGMTPNGDAPVLLTGYGGFNISLLPRYSPASIYWLERGGVYAVANLRGGGEFGETWHRDGALDRKEHVFEDFESVIRWLSSSGLSRPERIAITGGSNGGLLMGAMLTRAPDAFGAVVSSVGLYDMVRFARFPPASIWASEYGDPERADAFRWLYAYSPYHRVREGQRFPATWIETADHDTRVYWGHSTKFAARLQEAQSGDAPIFFYMQRDVGHGADTRRDDEVNRWTRLYTFIESQLQVSSPSTSTP
ncbi:MAG: prolyl oligopeptidase family serine peptidase [Polyangiales bacterium]